MSGIDDIVDMVLKEARGRPNKDPIINIFAVTNEVESKIIIVIDNLRSEQRRQKEDEQKTH